VHVQLNDHGIDHVDGHDHLEVAARLDGLIVIKPLAVAVHLNETMIVIKPVVVAVRRERRGLSGG
jgi:hypothetical protein